MSSLIVFQLTVSTVGPRKLLNCTLHAITQVASLNITPMFRVPHTLVYAMCSGFSGLFLSPHRGGQL